MWVVEVAKEDEVRYMTYHFVNCCFRGAQKKLFLYLDNVPVIFAFGGEDWLITFRHRRVVVVCMMKHRSARALCDLKYGRFADQAL